MRPSGVPIKTLLLRTFLPAVVVVAILLAGLVYNRLYATILDGFEQKLVTASTLTAAMIDPADHDRLIRAARDGENPEAVEATPLYQRNVAPIRRLREELGLTYLYTQVLGGPSDIFYVLDGSQGADHSAIGSPDDLTDATRVGLRRLQADGTIYVSPIEYQEQWGMLKTAAAPMIGVDGAITGSAGADVNISVIQVATQNALFTSAMIGILSILACLLVAMALVRRIAQPIEALTANMLNIAGGRAPTPGAPSGPREVQALGRALDTHVRSTASDAQRREKHDAFRGAALCGAILAAETGRDTNEPVVLVATDTVRIVWIAHPDGDPATILAHCAMTRLGKAFAGHAALAADWRDLIDTAHGSALVVDAAAGTAERVGERPLAIAIGGRRLVLDSAAPVGFDPNDSLVLVGADGREYPCWPGGAP